MPDILTPLRTIQNSSSGRQSPTAARIGGGSGFMARTVCDLGWPGAPWQNLQALS